MSGWIIEAEGLTKVYRMGGPGIGTPRYGGSTEVRALRGVNLRVPQGAFWALMGASGSGKSTLLHLLGCLDTPTEGVYRLEGQDASALSHDERAGVRNRRIGFVFQTFNLLPRFSALENVMLPLLYRGRVQGAEARARHALERVGLADRAAHRPVELSGGEQQRVAIARALIADPALLLADEPTGNLDSETGAQVMRLLVELAEGGRTLLMVTHDAQVAACARRTLHMHDGRIVDAPEGDR